MGKESKTSGGKQPQARQRSQLVTLARTGNPESEFSPRVFGWKWKSSLGRFEAAGAGRRGCEV